MLPYFESINGAILISPMSYNFRLMMFSALLLQALTLQQETLNRQVQEIAKALETPQARGTSLWWDASRGPVFAAFIGCASALAVCSLFRLSR